MSKTETNTHPARGIESAYAWRRLAASVLLMGLGGSGMWGVTVVLPLIQAEFGVSRSAASLPYTATMVGFCLGGLMMGRLSDRFGVMLPVLGGGLCLGLGLVAAGAAQTLLQFTLAQGLLIGFLGGSATFGPLVADISHWFTRRRGIAVAICISGNYVAGAFWPPVLQHFFDSVGWRTAYMGAGVFCVLALLPLVLVLRQRAPVGHAEAETAASAADAQHSIAIAAGTFRPLGLHPVMLQSLLVAAAVTCCMAMSMPQVHIVAYCGDLGFAAARGAEMLALMLGFGIVSRIGSGWIADRIGALRTLLLGSVLQAVALALYLPAEGLASLYTASILFGLFQGGIVPMYPLLVRDYFPASQAGTRVGMVLMATIFGMALGGWMSGAIFDLTGSYRAAFINGIAWNVVNIAIALELLRRSVKLGRMASAGGALKSPA